MSSREMQRRLKELAAALKAEPGSIPRRLELAAALREAKRPADAIELYRSVAEVYAEEGRLVQAMAVCKGILEIDPEHRRTMEMLATLAQRRAQRRPEPPAQVELEALAPDATRAGYGARKQKQAWLEPATSAGDDPAATRYGREEVSSVREALWGHTPPEGVPRVPGEAPGIDADLSEAPPEQRQEVHDTLRLQFDPRLLDEEVRRRERRARPHEHETVRMAQLSDEELAEVERHDTAEQPAVDEPAALPEPQPRSPGETAEPREHVDEPLYGEEDEAAATEIRGAITIPIPRPAFLVEPPPFPLLSELPRAAFLDLLARLAVVRLPAGELVLREGEAGDACYLVASGSVRVNKGGVEVAVLGPGSFFGELAVLADQRRHASVEAVEPVELLEISRGLLDELVASHPGVARTLRRFYRERLLATLMATAPFFQRLQPEERAGIADRFRPRRFGRGARIVEEGAPGGGLYLILVGEVEVVRGPAESEKRLGTLGEGSYFGEMSLLKGGTASATVRASRMTEVVQLPPRDFYEVVSQHPVLWEHLRSEAERREMANHAILAGEARKSDTFYLV